MSPDKQLAEKTAVVSPASSHRFSSLIRNEAGENLSWPSIFAGVITFIALSVLFSLVGVAIGLGGVDFTSDNLTQGVGTGLLVWSIFSLILSLAAAGFISGLTASRAGLIHGFLTWALGLIVALVMISTSVTSAFNTLGSVVGSVGSGVASASGSAADLLGDAVDLPSGDELAVKASGLSDDVVTALKKTQIEELQPDYLNNQLQESLTDLQNAGKRVIVDGEDLGTVTDDLGKKITDRASKISDGIDKDEIVAELSRNTDLTPAEAQSAADNIEKSFKEASTKTEQALKDISNQLDSAVEKSAQIAEDASNQAAKYSLWAFVGLLLAACITSFTGRLGARMASSTAMQRN